MTQPGDDRTARYDASQHPGTTTDGDTSPYAGGYDSSPYGSSAHEPAYGGAVAAPYTEPTTRPDQQWSFDDMYGEPKSPEPERPRRATDRLWPHLLWELLLAGGVVLAVIAVVTTAGSIEAVTGGPRDALLTRFAIAGFVATGFALSLRAATPNLAVGGAATLAATFIAWLTTEHGWNALLAALVTVACALVVGLVLAVLVVGLHVPAWAVTLGAGVLLTTLTIPLSGSRGIPLGNADDNWPLGWAIAFAGISILGGLLCATKGFRGFLGSPRGLDREPRDPAARPQRPAAAAATVALAGSTALAATGGVALIFAQRLAAPGGSNDLVLVAVAAALLGGVSAFGRRGGVLGVVLAVALITLCRHALELSDVDAWASTAVPIAGALLVGLVATQFVETANRRRADARAG